MQNKISIAKLLLWQDETLEELDSDKQKAVKDVKRFRGIESQKILERKRNYYQKNKAKINERVKNNKLKTYTLHVF
jgi:hypothetical protein